MHIDRVVIVLKIQIQWKYLPKSIINWWSYFPLGIGGKTLCVTLPYRQVPHHIGTFPCVSNGALLLHRWWHKWKEELILFVCILSYIGFIFCTNQIVGNKLRIVDQYDGLWVKAIFWDCSVFFNYLVVSHSLKLICIFLGRGGGWCNWAEIIQKLAKNSKSNVARAPFYFGLSVGPLP